MRARHETAFPHPACWIALAALTAACSDSRSSSSTAPPAASTSRFRVASVGRSATNVRVDGNIVAYLVREADEGGLDLNGDGDAEDFVPFIRDLATGAEVKVAHAVDFLEVSEPYVVFGVVELSDGGLDHNGDGDLSDLVPFVHDVRTGVTRNLGASVVLEGTSALVPVPGSNGQVAFLEDAASPTPYSIVGDTLAVACWSTSNPPQTTLHVFDLASGSSSDLGFGVHLSKQFESEERLVVLVKEWTLGMDLNADGDAGDHVLHVLDTTGGASTNLGFALGNAFNVPFFGVGDELVVFVVPEAANGEVDLDGDGDGQGFVVHAYDLRNGVVTNTLSATGAFSRLIVEGRRAALIDEHGLIEVYDADTGATTSTGIEPLLLYERVHGGFLFTAIESPVLGDGNGDGDLEDQLLYYFDFATLTATSTGLIAGGGVPSDPSGIAIGVYEWNTGGDLNGDGDELDEVLYRFDVVTGLSSLLGIEGRHTATLDLAALATEVPESDVDLNGDGDVGDMVAFVALSTGSTVENLRLAVRELSNAPRQYERALPLLVDEAAQGGLDLNGDGDALDAVLHLVTFAP